MEEKLNMEKKYEVDGELIFKDGYLNRKLEMGNEKYMIMKVI